MRTIFIDSNNKCHVTNDGTMTAVETDFFDGKCDAFVDGFCCEVGENGTAIYPWTNSEELEEVQRTYEHELLTEYESALAEIEAALGV